jgi:hypothetical protein
MKGIEKRNKEYVANLKPEAAKALADFKAARAEIADLMTKVTDKSRGKLLPGERASKQVWKDTGPIGNSEYHAFTAPAAKGIYAIDPGFGFPGGQFVGYALEHLPEGVLRGKRTIESGIKSVDQAKKNCRPGVSLWSSGTGTSTS